MSERWRPVVGWEGWYEVSDHGRVRRVRPGKGATHGRILRPRWLATGYFRYRLCDNETRIDKLGHVLVAEAFIGPRPEGYDIHHINHDKGDARLENLKYVTRSQNIHHSIAKLGKFAPRGEAVRWSQLTERDVRTIRRLRTWWAGKQIAKRFNVTVAAIYGIFRGKNWKHVADEGPVDETLLREAEGG